MARKKNRNEGPEGILLVDKPRGPTSFDIVARMRRALKTRAIGHTGTLDPLAEGLLVLLVGRYTRLSNLLTSDDKAYTARIDFGTQTTTDDAEGDVVKSGDASGLTEDAVREMLTHFEGDLVQTPPAFSAISVGGVRLYEKARRGEKVEVPTRNVRVDSLELLSFMPSDEKNEASAVVQCQVSKGTYIRALARDFGEHLGVPAHLGALRRTQAGKYTVSEAASVEVLEEEGRAFEHLQGGTSAIRGLRLIELDECEVKKLQMGQKLSQQRQENPLSDDELALAVRGEELVAIVTGKNGGIKPKRVLLPMPVSVKKEKEMPIENQKLKEKEALPVTTSMRVADVQKSLNKSCAENKKSSVVVKGSAAELEEETLTGVNRIAAKEICSGNVQPAAAPLVLMEEQDHIVTITLNRESARNAMSRETLNQLCEHLEAVAPRRDVRAVILAGAGDKAFSAGADLKERVGMSAEETRAMVRKIRGTMDLVERLPMPTLAAVNGFAFGGGCELALACDLRVLGENAIIGLTECALGIIPGAGGTQRLPRLVGVAKAKELIFTARRLSAGEALEIGLANRVVEAGGALVAARALAEEIKKCAPISVETAKAAIDGGLGMGIQEGLLLEARAYEVTLFTEDRIEALQAFREKRTPVFKGC